jgi:hypothetical protein
MVENNNNKDLKKVLDDFLQKEQMVPQSNEDLDCSSGVCVIKNDKSIQERINKKIITEDGRQLLI